MKLIRGLQNLTHPLPPSVVTIGNFDGFHLGHQQLISQLKKQANQLGLASVVITFEPQPNEYFHATPPGRLMKFRDKWMWLLEQGIDYVLCIRFDKTFSEITAHDFVEDLLIKKLNTRVLIVGDDFRFGAKRQGDIKLLLELSQQMSFKVIQLSTLKLDENRISSSLVRKFLQAGQLELAAKCLDRPYQMWGKVAHGKKIGQRLGFPTANIETHRREVPLMGIFVVQIHGIDSQPLPGVANLGTRPVFNGTRVLLEVYIFNFEGNLYGKQIGVEFLHKLRDESYFDHEEDLVRQIEKDVANAKEYFDLRACSQNKSASEN